MTDALKHWLADLGNPRAGWVNRRDAAEALGSVARCAYDALASHLEDPDMDVRNAVVKALAEVKRPEVPAVAETLPSLSSLVNGLDRAGRREVAPEGEGFVITVTLAQERKQKIFLSTFTPADGRPLVRIHSWCGEERASILPWLLKNNAKLSHCAFALLEDAGVTRIALVENLPLETATAEQVKRTVKEVAHFGDWVEQRMSEVDTF